MSHKLNSLSTLVAFAVLIVSPSVTMSQISRTTLASEGPKAAVVAVKRKGRIELVGDKKRLIGAMQEALNSGKEPGMVSDISIRSFENVSYLSILIEKQGTLFLELEPSGGGIQGKFYVGEAKYLYCESAGCNTCDLVMTGPGGPHCECYGVATSYLCKLKPRLYVNKLVPKFNLELLEVGFEEAKVGASTSERPRVSKGATRIQETKQGQTDPLKRPDN